MPVHAYSSQGLRSTCPSGNPAGPVVRMKWSPPGHPPSWVTIPSPNTCFSSSSSGCTWAEQGLCSSLTDSGQQQLCSSVPFHPCCLLGPLIVEEWHSPHHRPFIALAGNSLTVSLQVAAWDSLPWEEPHFSEPCPVTWPRALLFSMHMLSCLSPAAQDPVEPREDLSGQSPG